MIWALGEPGNGKNVGVAMGKPRWLQVHTRVAVVLASAHCSNLGVTALWPSILPMKLPLSVGANKNGRIPELPLQPLKMD